MAHAHCPSATILGDRAVEVPSPALTSLVFTAPIDGGIAFRLKDWHPAARPSRTRVVLDIYGGAIADTGSPHTEGPKGGGGGGGKGSTHRHSQHRHHGTDIPNDDSKAPESSIRSAFGPVAQIACACVARLELHTPPGAQAGPLVNCVEAGDHASAATAPRAPCPRPRCGCCSDRGTIGLRIPMGIRAVHPAVRRGSERPVHGSSQPATAKRLHVSQWLPPQ